MLDRRQDERPEGRERRSFPRPPLWLNFTLLVIAGSIFLYARAQHLELEKQTAILLKPTPASPMELNRIRDELSRMDVSQEQLGKELESRMSFLSAIKSEQFYVSIDTQKRLMQFRFGKNVIREAPVQIGEARTVTAPDGRSWTFAALKGAFSVTGKEIDGSWVVPEWAYALKGQPQPPSQQLVQNGLGKYVISLPNNYVIHSPPSPDSLLQGPKPGSFLVPESDLAAIWPRITVGTRVYVF